MKPVPTKKFMSDFWQLDMFGRSVVTRKEMRGSWAPAGYEETERGGPFGRRRGRSKR